MFTLASTPSHDSPLFYTFPAKPIKCFQREQNGRPGTVHRKQRIPRNRPKCCSWRIFFQNLAVCLAPNLLHTNSKTDKMNSAETRLVQMQTSIVQILITNADKIGKLENFWYLRYFWWFYVIISFICFKILFTGQVIIYACFRSSSRQSDWGMSADVDAVSGGELGGSFRKWCHQREQSGKERQKETQRILPRLEKNRYLYQLHEFPKCDRLSLITSLHHQPTASPPSLINLTILYNLQHLKFLLN